MFSWSDVGFAEIAAVILAISSIMMAVLIYYQRACINSLNNMYTHTEGYAKYYQGLYTCKEDEVKVLNELLDTYRPLAKKLVSVHVTSTYLHLKVRSDYAQDGDASKAIDEIAAILKDQL